MTDKAPFAGAGNGGAQLVLLTTYFAPLHHIIVMGTERDGQTQSIFLVNK